MARVDPDCAEAPRVVRRKNPAPAFRCGATPAAPTASKGRDPDPGLFLFGWCASGRGVGGGGRRAGRLAGGADQPAGPRPRLSFADRFHAHPRFTPAATSVSTNASSTRFLAMGFLLAFHLSAPT